KLAEPGLAGLAAHHLPLIGVEAAAEGHDLDRHQAAPSTARSWRPVAGSRRPENSHSAGPESTTWSSSRHSTRRMPPGAVIVTSRPDRPVRAAATAAAQAALPQALVRPAPRSHVRIVMASRAVTCTMEMLARSGKIG